MGDNRHMNNANNNIYIKYCHNCGQKMTIDSHFCPKCGVKLLQEESADLMDEKNLSNSCTDTPSGYDPTEVMGNLQHPESSGKKKTVNKKVIAIIAAVIVLVVILLFADGGKKYKLFAVSMGDEDNIELSKEYGGTLEGEAIVRNSRVDFYIKESSSSIKFSCKLSEKITEDGTYTSCEATSTSGEKNTIYNVYIFYFDEGDLAIYFPLSSDCMFLFEK